MAAKVDVIVVGSGLAGLCCALKLHQGGIPFLLLETSDGVGGRVRTDRIEGFLLDRGFQVLLTAYPEAQRVLDYRALDLRYFYPGALVRFGGRFHKMADPWRHPLEAFGSLFAPVGKITDKMKVGRLRRKTMGGSVEDLFRHPETTTLEAL
jgi:phytoene dehydrogenase-like protein